jgi:hypothetical protein
LWIALACCASAARAAQAPLPVAVTVREPDNVERRHWPLTVSVPFARSTLAAAAPVRVVDDRGKPLPTQARPLVRWPDGSVRWLLVDTQIDIGARHEKRLRVEAGAAPPPSEPLRISEGTLGIDVDTGRLRFRVPDDHFAVAEALRPAGADTPVVGAIGATLVAGERTGKAQPPRSLRVTERGPLRSRIELRGSYGNNFDYLIRLEAYAGQPSLRVWHTFINRHPTPYVSLPQLAVDLPLGALKPEAYRFGINGERAHSGELGEEGLQLVQVDNLTYAVGGERSAGTLAGWIELTAGRARVGVAARWFWQEYPQSFAAKPEALTYNMYAPQADPARAGVGAAKTHEFAIWVAPPAWKDGAAAGLGRPLVGVVDPAHLARSRALPGTLPLAPSSEPFARKALEAAQRYLKRNASERWDDCGEVHCTAPGLERPRTGAFGMWNWGDWNFRGYEDRVKGTDTWGNLEYDTIHVLALSYAASGNPELFDAMVAAARHFIDVDTIHDYPSRPEWVGMNHPKNPLHFSFELGGPDLGHTWTEGSIAYYFLTGDERGLAAARGVADYLRARVDAFVRGNPRQWGWPQIALLAVYDATGERAYLDAALKYARGGMAAHPPTTTQHWKLGILADALAHTHAVTGDAAIKQWLERYVARVMERKAREDARVFPAVAYLASITGDTAMRDAALARAQRLDLGSWGKPFTVNGRIGFRIYSLLSDGEPVRR